jgi:cell division protein FtsB
MRIPYLQQLKSWHAAYREHAWANRLTNKYVLVGVGFGVYMLFFDAFNVFERANLSQALRQAQSDREYYEEEIESTRDRLDELLLDERTAEKFAREEYLMKRPDEDVFVILEE